MYQNRSTQPYKNAPPEVFLFCPTFWGAFYIVICAFFKFQTAGNTVVLYRKSAGVIDLSETHSDVEQNSVYGFVVFRSDPDIIAVIFAGEVTQTVVFADVVAE